MIAARLGEEAAPLAARVPVLRGAVCDALVASFAAAQRRHRPPRCSSPAPICPCSRCNQLRMVLRLEQAYGLETDPRERAPELLATLAAGFGLRAVARQLLDRRSGSGVGCKGRRCVCGHARARRGRGRAAGNRSRRRMRQARVYAAAGRSFARRALIARSRWVSRAQAQGSTSR